MELLVVALVVLGIAGFVAVRAERRYERLEGAVKAWLGSLSETQLAHLFAGLTDAQQMTLMQVNQQLAGKSAFLATEQRLATEPASPEEPFVAPAGTCVAYLRDPDDVNCGLLLAGKPARAAVFKMLQDNYCLLCGSVHGDCACRSASECNVPVMTLTSEARCAK
jgi:hypothetical protein